MSKFKGYGIEVDGEYKHFTRIRDFKAYLNQILDIYSDSCVEQDKSVDITITLNDKEGYEICK